MVVPLARGRGSPGHYELPRSRMSGSPARSALAGGRWPPPSAPALQIGSPAPVRTTADPTPDHRVPLGALRGIVRRRYIHDPRECPQALLHPLDLGAGPPSSAHRQRSPSSKAVFTSCLNRAIAVRNRHRSTVSASLVPTRERGNEDPMGPPILPLSRTRFSCDSLFLNRFFHIPRAEKPGPTTRRGSPGCAGPRSRPRRAPSSRRRWPAAIAPRGLPRCSACPRGAS